MIQPSPALLTLDEAAAELRVNRKTLLNWRANGTGPRGFRVGRSVLFDRSEIRLWLDRQRSADPIRGRTA